MSKRKRSSTVSVNVLPSQPGIGPILVSFPTVSPQAEDAEETPFKVYRVGKRRKTAADEDDDDEGRTLVVGETPSVEFTSNEDENGRIAGEGGCRYVCVMIILVLLLIFWTLSGIYLHCTILPRAN
jgi:hypothetical protein